MHKFMILCAAAMSITAGTTGSITAGTTGSITAAGIMAAGTVMAAGMAAGTAAMEVAARAIEFLAHMALLVRPGQVIRGNE